MFITGKPISVAYQKLPVGTYLPTGIPSSAFYADLAQILGAESTSQHAQVTGKKR